jgi:hypothetical protein
MPNVYTSKPNTKLKQETILLQIQKVTGSNLRPQTDHSDIFHSFPHPLQTKSKIVAQNLWPQLLPKHHLCVFEIFPSSPSTETRRLKSKLLSSSGERFKSSLHLKYRVCILTDDGKTSNTHE